MVSKNCKFYARSTAGKYTLDTTELRSSFLLSEDFPRQVKLWRDSRLVEITGGNTPVPLIDQAKLILHIVPYESLQSGYRFSGSNLAMYERYFCPVGRSILISRLNVDGLVTTCGNDRQKPQDGYCQIFRDGKIESVLAGIISMHSKRGYSCLASTWYERVVIEGLSENLEGLRKLGISTPFFISMVVLGVKGAYLAVKNEWNRNMFPIDRDLLILPEVLIEDFDNLPLKLKPMFDAVWNAAGLPQSENYDAEGGWNPPS